MYDLLDRPVASLGPADRFLIGAMRRWVHALTMAGEPVSAVATGFATQGGGAEGCDRFDAVMRTLDGGSIETLTFQRPCHATVEETEAVMLGLWRMVAADRLPAAIATARLLVADDAAGPLVSDMIRARAAMRLD